MQRYQYTMYYEQFEHTIFVVINNYARPKK